MIIIMKSIQDNNLAYNILSPLVKFATRCHYNNFVVHGIENLPTDGAYIIAPCHQQALMEPLAVLRVAPKPPVFLARADLFSKPTLRSILTFLKIMPVYRIRDGQDKLGRNKEIFDRSREVLLDGYPLCLMAEGRHNNRHHLLNMGKGLFRIAGETQLALGDHPLYIVPTGIDFDEYEQPYSNLVVNIGRPIAVKPFMDTYRNNEPLALNRMRDALFEALQPLMHDIRNDEHYDGIMTLCNILNSDLRHREGLRDTAWNRFLVRQRIAQQMDSLAADSDEFAAWMTLSKDFHDRCANLHLGEKTFAEHWSLIATVLSLLAVSLVITVVLTVPLIRWTLLFFLLCYPIAVLPTHLIVKRKVADPQFRSSFNFGVRFFFSIIYIIVIAIVVASTKGMWMDRLADLGAWWGLAMVPMVFVCARVTAPVTVFLRRTLNNCYYWLLRFFRRRTMRKIDKIHKTLKDYFRKSS